MRDIIGEMRCGMMGGGYEGRTTSPKSARGVCRFFGPPPQSTKGGNRNGKLSASRKKNAYFSFNLLIINDINQYFNIHLHLISFIIYNR